MGRELAQALEPAADLGDIRRALADTAQARSALAVSGVPPWDVIPETRPTLEAIRVPGSVAEGGELAALLPLLDAAGRLRAYGRGIPPIARRGRRRPRRGQPRRRPAAPADPRSPPRHRQGAREAFPGARGRDHLP